MRGEGMLELGHEVHRVVVARPAELAAGDLSFHLVVADDADLVVRNRVDAPAHLEEEVGLGALREGDLGDAGPGGDGEAHIDGARSRIQLDPIAARCGLLLVVREGLTRRLGGGTHGTDGGEDGHVLVGRAPGAAQVGEAEASDAGVADVVTAA
jgi:hypothetical protein